MRRVTQSGLVLVVGVIAATATANGLFLNFVKPALRIPLVLAAVLLVGLGLYGFFVEERRRPAASRSEETVEPVGQHGHGHGARGPRVGWLLVIPFLLLGVVVPPPLGSYAAERDSGVVDSADAEGLGALPPGDPAELGLGEYSARALYAPASLAGRTVRLTGFSSPGAGGRWVLTRMALNCCAADGFAIKVAVQNVPEVDTDEWVQVTGRFDENAQRVAGGSALPVFVADDVRPIRIPENPYE
ncbi:MAG: TIGR03943 family putative permease subunit [Dermatophilaceae bacterium]